MGNILALVSPPGIQTDQTGEKNMLRVFQCTACHHGNPFPSISAALRDGSAHHGVAIEPQGRTTPWGRSSRERVETGQDQDEALHISAMRICESISALALALSRKAGQPLKSLRGHFGRQVVEKCQLGMLPTDKRSEEKSLWSLTLELPIMGHVLLETDNQETCWLRSAREGVRVRRVV